MLRAAVEAVCAQLVEAEVSELVGAELGEPRPEDRMTHRNGATASSSGSRRPRRTSTRRSGGCAPAPSPGRRQAHRARRRGPRGSALARMVAPGGRQPRRHGRGRPVQPGAVDHRGGSAPSARGGHGGRVRAVPRELVGRRRGLMVARRRVAILRRRARVHGRRTGVGRVRRRRATLLHRARVGQRAAARRLPDLHGDEAILDVADHVRALGRQYAIREFLYDPWRAGQLAQELEREGVVCVQFN
jgi:hypothetical protein